MRALPCISVGQAVPSCSLSRSTPSLAQHSRPGACPAELGPAQSAYLAPALGPAAELAPELAPAPSAYLAPAPALGPATELAPIGTPGGAPELAPLPAPEVAPASAPGVAPGVAAGTVSGAAPSPGPITNGFPVRLAVTGEELAWYAWSCTQRALSVTSVQELGSSRACSQLIHT